MQSLISRKERHVETTGKLAKTTTKEGREEPCRKTKRLGEVAGGTTAECAAVCCCCPCTLMHLLVLAIFKVPACLCKRAKKRHRLKKKKKKEALLAPSSTASNETCIDKLEREVRAEMEKQKSGDDHDGETEAVDLEKEMWDRFYATGFWRSPSQRSTT